MDTSNVINLLLLVLTAASTILAITQAIGARKASAEASQHERAANAARAEAAAATTRVADLLQEQQDREPDWVPESRGGGHLTWDMVNRTGKRVIAWLGFPDLSEANRMGTTENALVEIYLEPGEGIPFTWARYGVPGSTSTRVDVYWSSEDRSVSEKVTRVRVKWPAA